MPGIGDDLDLDDVNWLEKYEEEKQVAEEQNQKNMSELKDKRRAWQVATLVDAKRYEWYREEQQRQEQWEGERDAARIQASAAVYRQKQRMFNKLQQQQTAASSEAQRALFEETLKLVSHRARKSRLQECTVTSETRSMDGNTIRQDNIDRNAMLISSTKGCDWSATESMEAFTKLQLQHFEKKNLQLKGLNPYNPHSSIQLVSHVAFIH